MHLRGLCHLRSSAVYKQGQLTIELIRQAHNRLLAKANENVANQRKHKLHKRRRHENVIGASNENFPEPPYPLIRLWVHPIFLLLAHFVIVEARKVYKIKVNLFRWFQLDNHLHMFRRQKRNWYGLSESAYSQWVL